MNETLGGRGQPDPLPALTYFFGALDRRGGARVLHERRVGHGRGGILTGGGATSTRTPDRYKRLDPGAQSPLQRAAGLQPAALP